MITSIFNIEDFKSSMLKDGVARPSRFEIIVTPPLNSIDQWIEGRDMSIRCNTGALPPLNVISRDYIVGQGQYRMMPRTYDNGHKLTFTFYGDASQKIYKDLLSWVRKIFPANTENNYEVGFYNDYIGSVVVKQLNERNEVTYSSTLKEAYPVVVEEIKLDSSDTNKAEIIVVVFAYRHAIDDSVGEEVTYGTLQNVYTPENSSENDPTMVDLVKTVTDENPEGSYDIVKENVTATLTMGNIVKNEQLLDWSSTKNQIQAAIDSGDVDQATAALEKLTTDYNNTTADTNSYLASVTKTQKSYYEIEDEISSSDIVAVNMKDLQSQYKSITNNQVNINSDYESLKLKLNQIINPPTILIEG